MHIAILTLGTLPIPATKGEAVKKLIFILFYKGENNINYFNIGFKKSLINYYRFCKESSGDILDLYSLSLCDRILGPWSTYSRWVSFIGEVLLCFIEDKDQQFTDDSFSIVTDFYHFANGKSNEDFWKPKETK